MTVMSSFGSKERTMTIKAGNEYVIQPPITPEDLKGRKTRLQKHLNRKSMRLRKLIIEDVVDRHAKSGVAASESLRKKSPWRALAWLSLVLFLEAGLAITFFSVFAWPWFLREYWQKLIAFTASPGNRAAVIAGLVVAGFLLYLARTFMRPFYGAVEIVIGITSCWVGLSNSSANTHTLSATLSVIGGVYIIIRGFDNLIDDKSFNDYLE